MLHFVALTRIFFEKLWHKVPLISVVQSVWHLPEHDTCRALLLDKTTQFFLLPQCNLHVLQDCSFSQRCCWRSKFSQVWHCVSGRIVADVSKDRSVSVSNTQQCMHLKTKVVKTVETSETVAVKTTFSHKNSVLLVSLYTTSWLPIRTLKNSVVLLIIWHSLPTQIGLLL